MFLLSRLKTYLAVAGAVIVVITAAYFRGKKTARYEFERDADKHLIDSMRVRREVEDEIHTLDDTGLSDRASKWLREVDNS